MEKNIFLIAKALLNKHRVKCYKNFYHNEKKVHGKFFFYDLVLFSPLIFSKADFEVKDFNICSSLQQDRGRLK